MFMRPDSSSRSFLFALLTGLLALASCASPSRVELEHPLPFRVALMPVELKEDPDLNVATPASFSKELPNLTFTEEELQGTLVSTLRRRGFTDVVPLANPEVATTGGKEPASEDFAKWMDEAEKVHADLLLKVKLAYEPNIDGEINEKFWLNLPLFLLGGPFCYFINDRSYAATAQLTAQFFSVKAGKKDAQLAALLDDPLLVEFKGTQLDFTDRAGSVGAYAVSLLIPAGLLQRNSDRVPEEVRDAALEELSAKLLERIGTQRDQFTKSPGFSLVLDKSSAQRISPDTVKLSATVHLNSGDLKLFRVLSAPGAPLKDGGDLSGGSGKERLIQCDLPASQDLVQLEIVDGKERSRSYTFRVDAGR